MPTDLNNDELDARLQRHNLFCDDKSCFERRLIAQARKVAELDGEVKNGLSRLLTKDDRIKDYEEKVAALEAELIALRGIHSEYKGHLLRADEKLVAQARKVAALWAELTQHDTASNCLSLLQSKQRKLAAQAALLGECARVIDWVRCDMDCQLEGSNCTDPSGHWPDCTKYQARALLAKLPKPEDER